jgi:hypothetical protein
MSIDYFVYRWRQGVAPPYGPCYAVGRQPFADMDRHLEMSKAICMAVVRGFLWVAACIVYCVGFIVLECQGLP